MKNCVGISEELYNGFRIIPRSFYMKQLMVAILISGNLICLTKISNSDLVFTLSLLMISRVIYFLVIFKTKPMTLSSLKLLNKSGQLFTSSTLFVLLVWSEYKSISSIFVKDFTNGIIVLFTGTCFLLISILKRRLNHPELEIQTVDFELLSSLFSIFSGICLCFYGDISAIDHSFNIILCLILLIYTLIISAKGVYELSNAVKNIEVDIDQIFRKVIEI
jgi:hypothetical protein